MSAGLVIAGGLAWLAATAGVATIAYRIARRRARRPFPADLRADLAGHKRHCLGEPPDRVARELALYLGDADPRDADAPGAAIPPGARRRRGMLAKLVRT